MKEVLKELTKEQIEFIEQECGIDRETLFSMSEEALYDDVYDIMCDIEIDEIPDSDEEEESERCIMASDIVTLLGNTMEIPDEEDEDDDDEEDDK